MNELTTGRSLLEKLLIVSNEQTKKVEQERDRLKVVNAALLEALEQAVQAQNDGIPVFPTLTDAEVARTAIAQAQQGNK